MAQEGIMALPTGGDMQEGRRSGPLQVSSADSYDAAKTALGMVDPQALAVMRESLRQNIAELELTSDQIDAIVDIFEYMTRRPDQYAQMVKQLEQQGVVDPGDLPEEYDPVLIGTILTLLNEMRQMRGDMAQAPMQVGPGALPSPMNFAEGGLADVAQYLASKGRHGDTMLAHITPSEARLLESRGGSGTINPETGLPEFFLKKLGNAVGSLFSGVVDAVKGVVQVAKKVLASPVGRVVGTIALAAVLGPTALGAALGTAGTAGLAAGAVTLAGGGTLKEALVSGALGYIGGGGDFGGLGSPLKAIGGALPGTTGSALNTGLATGVLGTGAGIALGMKPADALRMGLISGTAAGALQGLQPTAAAPGAEGAATEAGAGAGREIGTAAEQVARTAPTSPTSGAGPVGTARDMLGQGLSAQPADFGQGFKAPTSAFTSPADFGTSVGGAAAGTNYSLLPEGFQQAGLQPGRAFSAMDFSRAVGGTAPTTNYGLAARAPAAAAPAAPQSLLDRAMQGAKGFYDEYLSPSRPGTENAGLLTKYGPLALTGTALAMATGATKSSPASPSPLGIDESAYLKESEARARARTKELEDAGYGWRPGAPAAGGNVMVPTPSFSTIPIGNIPIGMPTGITNSPAGIAQPYNVAGLYGVPLLYGEPQRRAKGGEMSMTDFPRKNGPINGPGTGTSDSIPAMLSDGEFVFTAKAVRNAGGGSRRKGAARMYKLMKMLEGGPVKGK